MRRCLLLANIQRHAVAVAIALLVPWLSWAAESVDKVVRVGFVATSSASARLPGLAAFWERLAEFGYVEGRNLVIEERWADGNIDRLPALMADVVARKVDVLVTCGLRGTGAGIRAPLRRCNWPSTRSFWRPGDRPKHAQRDQIVLKQRNKRGRTGARRIRHLQIVICVWYVAHGTLNGFKNDNGFFCVRLPGESEKDCFTRATDLVRQHAPSIYIPHSAIVLFADCENGNQRDWEEHAPAVAAYRRESDLS